jgi:hypothetical protein
VHNYHLWSCSSPSGTFLSNRLKTSAITALVAICFRVNFERIPHGPRHKPSKLGEYFERILNGPRQRPSKLGRKIIICQNNLSRKSQLSLCPLSMTTEKLTTHSPIRHCRSSHQLRLYQNSHRSLSSTACPLNNRG